ncbi:MAG: cysteine--tRNA ligase [Burkholderiales bacterium]|nr:cysteine--tRNA ligase [Nitrosomonadaceae bacterium]
MQTIYNTLTRQKESFTTIEPGKVRLYSCGPTVYDYYHIGNARTFTVFDMVYRWLTATGYQVNYVRNITDIDDKIIERANANGETMQALTERMAAAMFEDSDRLKLLRPVHSPRATQYIDAMLDIIRMLEEKGVAYRGANGDVYYAVREFPEYGKLSRKNLDDLRAGERVAVASDKRDPLDFVLWKAAKPHEPKWPSIFGDGRPGWHIECSAMCREVLGEQIDIHGGGWDLQFPHHENEIAQSEGVYPKGQAKPFARYWMHCAFLNFDSEKMSKSLGNFFTLREVLNKLDAVQGGETVRFFLMRGHYRSEINYTWDTLEDARQTLLGFYIALKDVPPADVALDWNDPYAKRFRAALEDDFDTPAALAVLHELRREINRSGSKELAGLLRALGGTIGLLQDAPEAFVRGAKDSGSLDVDALVQERIDAKKSKNFARADEIRKQLDAAGIVLEDKPGGLTEWRRK